MTDQRFAGLADAVSELLRGSEGLLSWAWDDYMRAALATLSKPSEDQVLVLLERAFGAHHTSETVAGDEAAQQIAAANGGLRPGQHLFVSPGPDGQWLVGAWWPWGDGQTISLRIRLVDTSVAPPDALEQPLRAWFSV